MGKVKQKYASPLLQLYDINIELTNVSNHNGKISNEVRLVSAVQRDSVTKLSVVLYPPALQPAANHRHQLSRSLYSCVSPIPILY